ncbi:thioesterase family protein [Brevibacillus choshinensis]|uniref:acyl-CoA thioesterase n=1 Tax=Brevibacillus choshinensis TaxID=54911 RepID=UPI002E1B4F5E|nr:thioesterase family protein [Brevibacillus choshinensis]MED4749784.1 thioesterase family protein [Brevibacillus choshinensis]MED4779943.1 thioesterase family protein [Brevibacillus choshinensis]
MYQNQMNYKVAWGDTDAAGIVFYPNFYNWMVNGTNELFDAIGYPASKLFAEEKIGLPLLETFCSFKSPVFFEDNLQIVSIIKEIHDKVFKISHQFFRNETLLAEGYELRAWTSFAADKPKAVSIPDQVRDALGKRD